MSRIYESINSMVLRADGNRSRTIRVWREEQSDFNPIEAKREITEVIMEIQSKLREEKKEFLLISIPPVTLGNLIFESSERINRVQISDGAVEMGVVISKNWP